MARIRSIKPEIASDAKLARLSRETRYHFVLLWTQCDDAGCFRATPRLLLGQLYPHDRDIGEAKVDAMTADLDAGGFVEVRMTPDGPIGKVCNWAKHQKIDRPSKSHLEPIFASVSRVSRETPSHGVLSPESLVLSPESRPTDGSTTDQSVGPKPWQPINEPRLSERLPSSAGRNALSAVLKVAGSKTGIIAELDALLSGDRGANHRCTPEQLDVALSDYVTNGMSGGRWNARHFRACVRRAMQPDAPPAGTPPTSRADRALRAIEAL